MFILLPETAAMYSAWKALVTRHVVSGMPSDDARLVAAMEAHGLTAILTFDKTGFSRFPGTAVMHPAGVQPYSLLMPVPSTRRAILQYAAQVQGYYPEGHALKLRVGEAWSKHLVR